MADSVYDAEHICELTRAQGATPNNPPKQLTLKVVFSKRLYREQPD